jgi:hypothetical protein
LLVHDGVVQDERKGERVVGGGSELTFVSSYFSICMKNLKHRTKRYRAHNHHHHQPNKEMLTFWENRNFLTLLSCDFSGCDFLLEFLTSVIKLLKELFVSNTTFCSLSLSPPIHSFTKVSNLTNNYSVSHLLWHGANFASNYSSLLLEEELCPYLNLYFFCHTPKKYNEL